MTKFHVRPCGGTLSWRLGLIAVTAALTALGSIGAAAAQPPLLEERVVAALAGELSGAGAKRTVQELSLHHRQRGSRGFRAAAEVIRGKLAAYGLEGVEVLEFPADGEVFYGTQRSRPAWDADFAELWELAAPEEAGSEWRPAARIASWHDRPITLAQDSAGGDVEADLVDVGEGTSAADYEGKDVAGKLVLAASQPGVAARLAVARFGAAGIVSYAQNQRSAWWRQDETLVRWGHMGTFPKPETFGFMVSLKQARSWRERLARGETVRLRARVEAGQHPGSYSIVTAVIPGGDPGVAGEEIVFSCHLDHQRPGANDNASGCATILEVARGLHQLIREGEIPPPRRTVRFIWPPEIEGTMAYVEGRRDLAARARAVVHMDMVGGDAAITKAVFHVTRTPASLPSITDDVAAAFGRFVNAQSDAYAGTGRADYPLADPEGGKEPLLAEIARFSMGSDHQIWSHGSYRVPAIYLNDWPDRYIHTHADSVANIDATKLLRAAFIGAASGYYLASLEADGVPDLWQVMRRHALERLAVVQARSDELDGAEAANLLAFHFAQQRRAFASIVAFAEIPEDVRREAGTFFDRLEGLATPTPGRPSRPDGLATVYRRAEPRGPLWVFGYSYFDDRAATLGLERPALLGFQGRWGSGSEYAYEALNLIDGERTVSGVRDDLAAIYGSIPVEVVAEYLRALEQIGILEPATN